MPDRVISVPQATQIATRIKNKFDNVNGRLTTQEEIVERLNEGGLDIKDEVIEAQITNWLNNHPEATTTVQDNSITEAKIETVFGKKFFSKPTFVLEQFGGKADDSDFDNASALTSAIRAANAVGGTVQFGDGVYYFKTSVIFDSTERIECVEIKGCGQSITNTKGTTLIGDFSGPVLSIARLWKCLIHDFDIRNENGIGLEVTTNAYLTQIYNVSCYGLKCFVFLGFAYLYIRNCQLEAYGDGAVGLQVGSGENDGKTREYIFITENTIAARGETTSERSCIYLTSSVIHATIQNNDIMSNGYGIKIESVNNTRYIDVYNNNFVAYNAILLSTINASIYQLTVHRCTFNYSTNYDSDSRILTARRENTSQKIYVRYTDNYVVAPSQRPTYDIEAITVSAFDPDISSFDLTNEKVTFNIGTAKYYSKLNDISRLYRLYNPASTVIERVLTNNSPWSTEPLVFVNDYTGKLTGYTVTNTLGGELKITFTFSETWTGTKNVGVFVPGKQHITS